MPRVAKELSALEVKRLNKVGFNAVGTIAGLGLMISDTGATSWVYRVTVAGKRRNIGMGSYPAVTLAMAHEKARKAKEQIEDGTNPIDHKKQVKSDLLAQQGKAKTFKDCTREFLAPKTTGNAKHNKQWLTTLETYADPHIGNMLVKDIELAHVKAILDPIWYTKNETAKRLLGRIKSVIDYSITTGYREKANPAIWSGYLSTIYTKPSKVKKVKNMDSIHYSKMHDFMTALRKHDGVGAKALEFLILTAVRSESVRSATWEQINLEERIWTVPKEFTKTKEAEHKVPLSEQAIAVLTGLKRMTGTNLVFPSPTLKKLSDNTLSKLMRDMKANKEYQGLGVPHGFRATFSTWRLEKTTYSFELGELSLMHKVGNSVSEAYQRGDGFERRISIMQDWARFINEPYIAKTGNLIYLKKIA
jgi:integrase